MIKIIKSMKKNGVVEVTTSRTDKLLSNFASEFLDQHAVIKQDDKVMFRITLLDSSYPLYFYKMLVKEKLEHVLRLKQTATNFFKSSFPNNYKKAADLYQKINGYFNFGDATNNYAKEDETSEQFKADNAQLQSMKLICF